MKLLILVSLLVGLSACDAGIAALTGRKAETRELPPKPPPAVATVDLLFGCWVGTKPVTNVVVCLSEDGTFAESINMPKDGKEDSKPTAFIGGFSHGARAIAFYNTKTPYLGGYGFFGDATSYKLDGDILTVLASKNNVDIYWTFRRVKE